MGTKNVIVPRTVRLRQWASPSDQSVYREHVFILGTHRLQVRLRHGNITANSEAVLKRWSGVRWELVARIPPDRMTSWEQHLSYVQDQSKFTDAFNIMEADLLEQAQQILFD
jgi:hypothetical protein